MLVSVYKCWQGAAPSYLRTYLQVRDAGFYDLRGYAKLKPPAVRTTRFGLHSFRHLAPNQGSRLTFHLPSPVARDRFDSLAKTDFSLARYSDNLK